VEPMPARRAPDADDEERVPLFGTWRAIYVAVLATEAVMILGVALFQAARW
jgi:hypothetical protein